MSNFAQYVEYPIFKFVCPDCKGTQLEEIMDNCVVSSEIAYIYPEECGYGDQTTEYGFINRFQCSNCGYVLRHEEGFDEKGSAITEYEDLYNYCKEKGWIVEYPIKE